MCLSVPFTTVRTVTEYVVIAAVNEAQQVILEPVRVMMPDLPRWAEQHLTPSDEVVLEVGCNSWPIADLLRTCAGQVVAANPYKTKLIAQAHIKNDKVDALALARLLASRFICDVWIPEPCVRDQRALAAHRATLRKQCTQTKNRLHNLLRRHNLHCPEKSLFSVAGRQWLLSLSLSQTDALQTRHLLRQIDLLRQELDEADRLIARVACQDPRIPRLMQMCGIGYYTAFAIVAAIGDIRRFVCPNKLTAYFGLVPRCTPARCPGHTIHYMGFGYSEYVERVVQLAGLAEIRDWSEYESWDPYRLQDTETDQPRGSAGGGSAVP